MLKIKNIDQEIEDNKILKDINLDLKKGEFLGIVGPNGAGKTTLLRTISNVLEPKKGSVKIKNKDISNMGRKEISKLISMVPQNSYISFPFNALDIVLMGRSPYKGRFDSRTKKDKEKAEKYMKLTNTLQFKNRNVNDLSGGELQRIAIARALIQEPEILLMDEPTSHLDLNHEFEILSLIKNLQDEGLSIISVFHDLNLASRFCDRIVMLKNGEIFEKGKPKHILTNENVSQVFNANVMIKRNPSTRTPYIVPISHIPSSTKTKDHRIHVICGGGSGSNLLKKLKQKGYSPSVGVLNVLDSDYETADSLGLDIVSEAPFSPISEEAFEKNKELIKNSETIIISDVAFGKGNLKNLISVKEALQNQELIIIENSKIEEKDHTGGEAKKIYQDLSSKGLVAQNLDEVFELLEGENEDRNN